MNAINSFFNSTAPVEGSAVFSFQVFVPGDGMDDVAVTPITGTAPERGAVLRFLRGIGATQDLGVWDKLTGQVLVENTGHSGRVHVQGRRDDGTIFTMERGLTW